MLVTKKMYYADCNYDEKLRTEDKKIKETKKIKEP
jgi:hypothetical protein